MAINYESKYGIDTSLFTLNVKTVFLGGLALEHQLNPLNLNPLSVHQAECETLSTYQTAARAETLRPCRFPPAFGERLSGWRGGVRGGCGRRPGSIRPRSFHRPSRCGRRR